MNVKDMSISVILTVHEITGMKSNRMIKEMREKRGREIEIMLIHNYNYTN